MTRRAVEKGEYRKYATAIKEGLTVPAVSSYYDVPKERIYYVLNYYGSGVKKLRKRPTQVVKQHKPFLTRFIERVVGVAA